MSMSDKLKLIKMSIKENADIAVKKSQDLIEYSDLSLSMASCDKAINEICMEIGKKIYKMYKSGEDNPKKIIEHCEEIKKLEKEKEKIKRKILKLKDKKECRICGTLIDKKAHFCDKCGSKQ
jgi:rubrerythrin